MSILSLFDSELNQSATVKVLSITKDDEGRTISSYVDGATFIGFLEVRQEGTQLQGDKYTPLYKEYLITLPPAQCQEKDRLDINEIEYEVDFIDDIANQGEVLEIGLNRIG